MKAVFKQPNPCSNHEIHVLFEHGFYLKIRPWFVCMMLRGETLWLKMSIFSMLLLMSTLLVEMISLTFDFASGRHFVQRDLTNEI